jgi:hypothetical protein
MKRKRREGLVEENMERPPADSHPSVTFEFICTNIRGASGHSLWYARNTDEA